MKNYTHAVQIFTGLDLGSTRMRDLRKPVSSAWLLREQIDLNSPRSHFSNKTDTAWIKGGGNHDWRVEYVAAVVTELQWKHIMMSRGTKPSTASPFIIVWSLLLPQWSQPSIFTYLFFIPLPHHYHSSVREHHSAFITIHPLWYCFLQLLWSLTECFLLLVWICCICHKDNRWLSFVCCWNGIWRKAKLKRMLFQKQDTFLLDMTVFTEFWNICSNTRYMWDWFYR